MAAPIALFAFAVFALLMVVVATFAIIVAMFVVMVAASAFVVVAMAASMMRHPHFQMVALPIEDEILQIGLVLLGQVIVHAVDGDEPLGLFLFF